MPAYEEDFYAWTFEQARFLRERRFDLLDIEHLADEIEDIAKGEVRELTKEISALLAYLIRWHFLPDERTISWSVTIEVVRLQVAEVLEESPSLRPWLDEPLTIQSAWANALAQLLTDSEQNPFPNACPWAIDDVLSDDWLPSRTNL
jgi:hypothetical protein